MAVGLEHTGSIEVLASHGLDDLLDGVWRRNPTRVTVAEYQRRLGKKDPASRWPAVRCCHLVDDRRLSSPRVSLPAG